METSTDPTLDQAPPSVDLEFHPAAALFPLMGVGGPEFGELVDVIRQHGLVPARRSLRGQGPRRPQPPPRLPARGVEPALRLTSTDG